MFPHRRPAHSISYPRISSPISDGDIGAGTLPRYDIPYPMRGGCPCQKRMSSSVPPQAWRDR